MIKQASAEFLLNHLFPGREAEWRVHKKGRFYRNYSQDILDFDKKNGDVSLSRESILNLLPPDLVSPELELLRNETKGRKVRKEFKTKYDEIHRRVALLQEAFMPCDTFIFRDGMRLERQTDSILKMKMPFILKEFFDFDIEKEDNPYVYMAALMLPYAVKIRGNMHLIRIIISTIVGCEVEMQTYRYGKTSNLTFGIPKVQFNFILNGLDAENYRVWEQTLRAFMEFVKEHFVPFDVVCDMTIKGTNPNNKLLDYNSYV